MSEREQIEAFALGEKLGRAMFLLGRAIADAKDGQSLVVMNRKTAAEIMAALDASADLFVRGGIDGEA